ncbi:hypothetical protein FSP39_008163 [Pinctada imbricata]|uniref:Endonuclease/exonuclease/phosphatase domain-containing protein n=1 Tax=Pinctada imbricata TaxID=66713 RepID=A0AA89BQU4_PINIB|nr:hypothetical protein FSP39_008163 [Pinctada imbricata]
MEEIEREFLSFIGNNDKYALIGDFNARTGNLSDYVELDDDIVEIINNGYDEDFREILFDYKNLIYSNIPLKRCSQDKGRPNSFGYKLIDFCTRCNLYIANGRIGQDRDVGKTTSNECSLIDYLIISSNFFKVMNEFEIDDFNPLYSDVHNLLHFCISMNVIHKEKDNNYQRDNGTIRSKWKMSKSDKFVENLNMKEENIKDLCNEVDNCSSEEHDIDGILSKLENIFSEAAIKSFGKSGRNNEQKEKSDRNNEIWFTKLCDE